MNTVHSGLSRKDRVAKRADHDDLNATAASLLGFLSARELSGYELMQVAEMVIGDFWSLTRSQVYRELAGLSAKGLVEELETGPRSRRPYRITQRGRAAFESWLSSPPAAEQIRYPLLLRISFGAAVGRETVLGFLAEHREIHEQRLAEYQDKQGTLGDSYLEAVLAFGAHYERAVLAWMDEVPDLLPP